MDLTSFNGISTLSEVNYGVTAGTDNFYTRERGECDELRPDRVIGSPEYDQKRYNLWPQQTNDSALTPEFNPTADMMPVLNTTLPPPPSAPTGSVYSASFSHTLGYLNSGYGQPQAASPGVPAGYPQFSTPWLVWNNRPFASQYELLKVPAFRSSRVLTKAKVVRPLEHTTAFAWNDPEALANRRPYGDPKNPADVPAATNAAVLHDPYGHTLNFFYSDANYDASRKTCELHRFLEFVHVPSRFVGTDTMLNPSSPAVRDTTGHAFHSPYNQISKYREPGRINLNTVFSENVWRGLTNFFPHSSPDPITGRSWQWNGFLRSRQGYESALQAVQNMGVFPAGDPIWEPQWKEALAETGENVMSRPLNMDPEYPTRFAKPFRGSFGSALVPLLNPATDFDKPQLMPLREVESTLLRSNAGEVYHNPTGADPTLPLPDDPAINTHRGYDFSNTPLFAFESATSDFCYDPSHAQDALFRYYLDENVAAVPPADGGVSLAQQVSGIWNVVTTPPEDVTPQPYWMPLTGTEMQTFIPDTLVPIELYDFNDPNRSTFFRYQGLQRLGNITTTRSNVYAVWLTVGYFEVENPLTVNPVSATWSQAQFDAVYPDGYAIGKEAGSDTGEFTRHRAFYLIDRSIPVGFERGEDHNVEDTILIKRFIE